MTQFLYWLPMIAIGMLNGIFRGLVLIRFMSESAARQVSSLLLVLWLTIYTSLIFSKLQISSVQSAVLTGLLWMVLTFAFETGMGYFISHLSLRDIFAEYNLFKGKLWSLVMIALLILPLVFFYLRNSD